MSVSLTIQDHWDDGKRLHVVGQLTFTGNYTTGGDAINLALAAIKTGAGRIPIIVSVNGLNNFEYDYVTGTNMSNGKIKVQAFSTGEINQAAYPAGVTGDTVSIYMIVHKFR